MLAAGAVLGSRAVPLQARHSSQDRLLRHSERDLGLRSCSRTDRQLEHTHNLGGASDNAHRYTHSTDRSLAVFGYSHKVTRKQVYTIWQRDSIPADANDLSLQELAISKTSRCTTPRF
jgi:hypothetical protein